MKQVPFEVTKYPEMKGNIIQDLYISAYKVRKTMFSNQTRHLPTKSKQGKKYIIIMGKIDSSAILVKLMKSRKDSKMIQAYNALSLQIRRAGIAPKKHGMDNKVSETMKNHICNQCKLELVPPGCHRRNAAEEAIQNFKTHFLSVLAGVADGFPPSLWDCLLPQTKNHTKPSLPI